MQEQTNGSDLIEHLPNHPELSERLELRASKEDVERWRQAGEARGLTLSAYVRQAARELALHPALARGALEGAWLELAQQGVNAMGRIVAELADRSDLMRTKPVEVVLRVVPPQLGESKLGGSKPPRRKPAKKKPAPPAPAKKQRRR